MWVKSAVDAWTTAITEGCVFRAINKAGRMWGDGMSPKVLWDVVRVAAAHAGIEKLAPHDLRRTCARLCHLAGGELERILPPGPRLRPDTTERYLGCKQKLRCAVNDRLGIEPDPADIHIEAQMPGRAPAVRTTLGATLPIAFKVMMVRDIAGRFSGNRTFVEELERLVPEFYENVGQHLEAFRPKPPQVKPEKPAAEAVPDASRGLPEVEVAANDAAKEALNGLVAGMGSASAGPPVELHCAFIRSASCLASVTTNPSLFCRSSAFTRGTSQSQARSGKVATSQGRASAARGSSRSDRRADSRTTAGFVAT